MNDETASPQAAEPKPEGQADQVEKSPVLKALRKLRHIGLPFAAVGEAATTVRRGFKWADLRNGETVELWRCYRAHDGECVEVDATESGCHWEGAAKVRGLWVGIFKTIPARLVEMEHAPLTRTYSALLASMKEVYSGFHDGEHVTVIIYQRTL